MKAKSKCEYVIFFGKKPEGPVLRDGSKIYKILEAKRDELPKHHLPEYIVMSTEIPVWRLKCKPISLIKAKKLHYRGLPRKKRRMKQLANVIM